MPTGRIPSVLTGSTPPIVTGWIGVRQRDAAKFDRLALVPYPDTPAGRQGFLDAVHMAERRYPAMIVGHVPDISRPPAAIHPANPGGVHEGNL